MKNKIILQTSALALTVGATMASATPTQGVTFKDYGIRTFVSQDLNKSYEDNTIDRDFWKDATYRGEHIAKFYEDMSSLMMAAGHEALGLDDSMAGRAIYGFTAGYVAFMVQHFASIYYGHEAAHHSYSDYYGFEGHSFFNAETGMRDSEEVKRSILTSGDPDAAAYSYDLAGDGYENGYDEDAILHVSNGLNWQMKYSERWVRENLVLGGKSVFSTPNYLVNRMKTFAYALGDAQRGDSEAIDGDVNKIAQHYQDIGQDIEVEDIAVVGAASMFLSPATWSAWGGMNDYGVSGSLRMQDPFFETPSGSWTWDLPAYLNEENMSLAPMLYSRQNEEFIWGLGAEMPILGEGGVDYNIFASYTADHYSMDALLSSGDAGGMYAEVGLSLSVTDKLGIRAEYVTSEGDTYKGKRHNPYSEDFLYIGLQSTF